MWRSISVAKSVTINLRDVGYVLLERSYRAKHINISVKPPSKVRVAVPVGVKFEKARRIAEQRSLWIQKQLRKFSELKGNRISEKIYGEELISFKKYLRNRIEHLAQLHGFKYNNLTFKYMKTRWGSCSAKNNLNFNILMAHLPKSIQDYIIIHELLHTRIKSHSREFWAELDRITGSAKGFDKKLKENYVIY